MHANLIRKLFNTDSIKLGSFKLKNGVSKDEKANIRLAFNTAISALLMAMSAVNGLISTAF